MFRLIDSAKEGLLSVFAGAGISYDAPTNLPLAKQLVSSISLGICGDYLFSDQEQTLFQTSMNSMRPEIFFSILLDILEDEGYTPITLFGNAAPNENHFLIANLALRGHLACIVTTNFDLALERALNELGCQWQLFVAEEDFKEWNGAFQPLPLFKLHGSIIDPHMSSRRTGPVDTKDMAVTMEHIGKAFPEVKAEVLKWLLENTDFLFLGYSGHDEFDIYPLLNHTQSRRQHVWLSHVGPERGVKTVSGEEIQHQNNKDHIDHLLENRGTLGTRIFADTSSHLRSFVNTLDSLLNREPFDPIKSLSQAETSLGTVWSTDVKAWATALTTEAPSLPYLLKGALLGATIRRESVILENFQKAIDLAIKTGSSKFEAQARAFAAIQEGDWGRWPDAHANLTKAITIAERINANKIFMQASNELGVQLGRRGEFKSAAHIFRQALAVAPADSLGQEKALILHNLGNVYEREGNPNQAIECWKKAAQYRKECGDVVARASSLKNLANTYARLSLFAQAIEFMGESWEIMQKAYGTPPDMYAIQMRGLLLFLAEKAMKENYQISAAQERILGKISGKEN